MFRRLFDNLRKVNGRDAFIFVVALLVAFSIWLFHNLSQEYIDYRKVYIRVKSNIEGRSTLSSNVALFNARCRMSGLDLFKLIDNSSKKPVILNIDSRDLHFKSVDTYYINPLDLSRYANDILGSSATDVMISSDTLSFNFNKRAYKKIPIHSSNVDISYKEQYMPISDISIEPDSILIYAEPNLLNNISKVYTEAINLSNIDEDINGVLSLEPIEGATLSAESVNYSIKVRRYVEMRLNKHVDIINVPRSKKILINPSNVEVNLKLAFPVISNTDNLKLYVDYNDFEASMTGLCRVYISKLPDSIYDYSIEPAFVDCIEELK